jgi:hypothetical protein
MRVFCGALVSTELPRAETGLPRAELFGVVAFGDLLGEGISRCALVPGGLPFGLGAGLRPLEGEGLGDAFGDGLGEAAGFSEPLFRTVADFRAELGRFSDFLAEGARMGDPAMSSWTTLAWTLPKISIEEVIFPQLLYALVYAALGLMSLLYQVISNRKMRWAGPARRMDWSRLASLSHRGLTHLAAEDGHTPAGTTSRASSS